MKCVFPVLALLLATKLVVAQTPDSFRVDIRIPPALADGGVFHVFYFSGLGVTMLPADKISEAMTIRDVLHGPAAMIQLTTDSSHVNFYVGKGNHAIHLLRMPNQQGEDGRYETKHVFSEAATGETAWNTFLHDAYAARNAYYTKYKDSAAVTASEDYKRTMKTLDTAISRKGLTWQQLHPDKLAGFFYFHETSAVNKDLPVDTLKTVFHRFPAAWRMSEEGQLLAAVLEGRKDLEQNMLPVFHAVDRQGRTWSRDDLKGKYVLIDFWNTGCVPCIAAMPELKKISEKYKGDKLMVISVSNDPDGPRYTKMLAEKQMDWTQFRSEQLFNIFQVGAIPDVLLIGPDGKIVHRSQGYARDNPGWLDQLVAGYIK